MMSVPYALYVLPKNVGLDSTALIDSNLISSSGMVSIVGE